MSNEYGKSAEDAAYNEASQQPPLKMPNRAARRQAKKQVLGNIFSEMAKRAKEAQAQKQPEENMEEDLNILPLPESQRIIEKSMIVWTWPINDDFEVISIFYLVEQDEKFPGDYEVKFTGPGEFDFDTITFDSVDIAKKIGQALISASNYKNVWKLHAGTFLERELVQPASEGWAPQASYPETGVEEEPDHG